MNPVPFVIGLVGVLTFVMPLLLGVGGALGGILAVAGNTDAITAIATGTGATAAIGAIIWIAKKVIAGEVVPLPIKELTDQTKEQNRQLAELVTEMREQRSIDREITTKATEALFGVRDYLLRHDENPPHVFPARTPGGDHP